MASATDPKGWRNQLDNEPLFNFYYMRGGKLWQTRAFDIAVSGDAALGTSFSRGQVASEARLGRKQDGFAYVPTPIARGLTGEARLRTPGDR